MSVEKVKEYFKEKNLEDRVSEFETSSATVGLAAEAIGCSTNQIAKSLGLKTKNSEAILIVVSGDSKINNQKFKEEFNYKAKMLSAEETLELIGHGVGGVCPFCVRENVKIYLDTSLKENEIIYPAAGSSNSAVRLSIEELENLVEYEKWIDVTKK